MIRIVVIFGLLFFVNTSIERLSRGLGHEWPTLGHQLQRLLLLRRLRVQLVLVYLALPILFMFLEVQVLPWDAGWFSGLWRELLDLYLLGYLVYALFPSAATRAAHFNALRPEHGGAWLRGLYPHFFRWLLGMNALRRPRAQ